MKEQIQITAFLVWALHKGGESQMLVLLLYQAN